VPIDLAAHVAVIQNGQILLTKRAYVEAWALPGGQVDVGESVAEAAVREAREETGLEVRLTRLVGIYFIPQWQNGDNHSALFAASPVGGVLRPQEGEVIEARYFAPTALPGAVAVVASATHRGCPPGRRWQCGVETELPMAVWGGHDAAGDL
jgi:ADP-ribose pyrophosphatase YjhB (NUDIX family)